MKKILIFAVLSLFLISCAKQEEKIIEKQVVKENVRDGIFIHITAGYEDAHKVLMPLKMATMMAKDKDVLVYMDIHAVNLLVKDAKDLEYADFESAHTYIKKIKEMGGTIMACPTCLKIAGFKPEDLREGIEVANKDKFFNFTKGRIITLDY
jgi:Predicted peroxiredoxins